MLFDGHLGIQKQKKQQFEHRNIEKLDSNSSNGDRKKGGRAIC